MKFRIIASIALCSLLAACGGDEVDTAASADRTGKPRLAFVFEGRASTGANMLGAAATQQQAVADVAIYTPEQNALTLRGVDDLRDYDLVLIDGTTPDLPLSADDIASLRAETRLVVVNPRQELTGSVALDVYPDVVSYWNNRSIGNDAALIAYLAEHIVHEDEDYPVPEPVIYPIQGFYHPAADGLFDDREEFLEWYAERSDGHAYDPALPTIGLSQFMTHHQQNNMAVFDAMIVAIEQRGANAIMLLRDGSVDFSLLLDEAQEPVVDVLLYDGDMLNHDRQDQGLSDARLLGVTILQALVWDGGDAEQYRASPGGLAPKLTPTVVNAERMGMMEPIVIGAVDAAGPIRKYVPMAEQVEWRIERALAWAKLRNADNRDKKVVFTYWSEAGGKSDVGGDPDDFLDVQGSLEVLLQQMRARGYDTGSAPLPTAAELGDSMARAASNIGGWAQGELASRAASGNAALVSEAQYRAWYDQLPEVRRNEIEAVWGPPPGKVMTITGTDGVNYLVIPRMEIGNILLAPHPMWGYLENENVLMSKDALPPHHQYLAFFLWLQKDWQASAWVNLFSNLVLQPGKSQGPLADDHIGIMLGGLPHIHPERLGASGAIGTKRKGLGFAYGWYNIVTPAGSGASLSELRGALDRAEAQTGEQLAALDAPLRQQIADSGVGRALPLDVTTAPLADLITQTVGYLDELDAANMPWGGKILGTGPEGSALTAMVTGMLGFDLEEALAGLTPEPPSIVRPLVEAVLHHAEAPALALQRIAGSTSAEAEGQLARALEYRDLLATAPQEIDALFAALDGQWREPGPMGEPFRHPETLPPGRMLYNFDQRLLPTAEAEAVGEMQAEALIESYRNEHEGAYPDKVALVLFSGDIAKTNGASESQIMHLMGTRVKRNWRGEVIGAELIPREELGRPRIDVLVTTSGVYRDHFQDKVELITQATKLAAESPEQDNPIRKAVLASASDLQSKGESESHARLLASARVFSPAPGAYSPSIQFLAKSGEQRGDEARMAELFTRRLSHAYGGGLYGTYSQDAFKQNLGTMDAAVLPRSGDVNALLENPMPAGFLGGLNLAAKSITGNETELFVSNLQDMSKPGIELAAKALQTELRTRYFNPEWLKENQTHGYDGARNFMFLTDHLDLWDSTATDMVSSADWAEVKQVFVDDKFKLGMDAFFEQSNPFAQQMLLTNLLGAAQRGQWQATAEELAQVAERLVQSVADNGPACEANQCRNPAMTDFVGQALSMVPDAAPLLEAYAASIAQAVMSSGPADLSAVPGAAPQVTGRAVEEVSHTASAINVTVFENQLVLLALAAVLLLLAGWWQGGRSRNTEE